MSAMLLLLRRIPLVAWIAFALVAGGALGVARVKAWKRNAVVAAIDSSTAHTRDSVSTAAKFTFDSATLASAIEIGALREVYAVQQRATLHLQRTIAGKAATDSLYAAKARLSESAKADSTVVVFVAASDSVVAENGQLKTQATGLIESVAETEQRARAVHAADTAVIRGLSGALVSARDSLAVEASKPKRSLKSTLFHHVSGAAIWEIGKAAVKALARK